MLSIGMCLALELRAIRKRFSVGAGACLASAEVLRGVDLDVAAGESVAVLGPSASGKSTLMLCAAGLLRPESGELKWFGDSSRAVAAHRVRYYCSPADLVTMDRGTDAQLHLVDFHAPIETNVSIASWIDDRCGRGDSVILVAHDERFARHAADRVLALEGGVLRPTRSVRARVAERMRA